MNTPIALILLVIGIILLVIGLGSADSIANSFSRMFTGHLTDRTTLMIVCGCVIALVGLIGCYRGRRA